MDNDVVVFAQVMVVIVGSVASLVVITMGAWRVFRADARAKSRVLVPADDSRLDRLEAAVDAIAIEVERISESQRFTVNLLTERLPARPADRVGELPSALPGASKRSNTPH